MTGKGRGCAAAALAVAAFGLAACGGDDAEKAEPLGKKIGGSVAPLADCKDWNSGSRERQLATIADVRNQVSRNDTGVDSPPLSDEEATMLFDKECAASYAASFRLYVIYARGAGFAPLLRDGDGS